MARVSGPWLDSQRFPGRAWLPGLVADEEAGPRHPGDAAAEADGRCLERLAAVLRCAPEEIALAGTVAEAMHVAVGCLLTPQDVALVGELASIEARAAVLSAGARYVQLPRRADGTLVSRTARRALDARPDSLVLGESPHLLGGDDWPALASLEARARCLDCRRRPLGAGGSAPWPADACLLALHDPGAPARPLAWVVRVGAAQAHGFASLRIGRRLPAVLLERIGAALAEPERWTQAMTTWWASLDRAWQALAQAVGPRPGIRLHPRAGAEAALETLDCPPDEISRWLPALGWRYRPVRTDGSWPLVLVDLRAPPKSSGPGPPGRRISDADSHAARGRTTKDEDPGGHLHGRSRSQELNDRDVFDMHRRERSDAATPRCAESRRSRAPPIDLGRAAQP
jgi:hypothetical protein